MDLKQEICGTRTLARFLIKKNTCNFKGIHFATSALQSHTNTKTLKKRYLDGLKENLRFVIKERKTELRRKDGGWEVQLLKIPFSLFGRWPAVVVSSFLPAWWSCPLCFLVPSHLSKGCPFLNIHIFGCSWYMKWTNFFSYL